MNEALKAIQDEKEDRLIDKQNIQSLYICLMNAIVSLRLTGSEVKLLLCLCCHAERNGTGITAGRDRLIEKSGLNKDTEGKVMKSLQKKGLLIRTGKGDYGVAKYRVNLPGHYLYVDPNEAQSADAQQVQQVQQVQVQVQVQQVQQSPSAQQVQQVQVQVQVQQVQQVTTQSAAPQEDQGLDDIFDDDQAATIVESTVSHPLDQNIQPIDEEIERRIKLLLCAKKGNETKQQPTSGFSAIGRRLNFDAHEIVYLWSHPVKFEDVCKIYQNGIPEQKRPELTAISSDLVTELPF